jgi:hypothetical protein
VPPVVPPVAESVPSAVVTPPDERVFVDVLDFAACWAAGVPLAGVSAFATCAETTNPRTAKAAAAAIRT